MTGILKISCFVYFSVITKQKRENIFVLNICKNQVLEVAARSYKKVILPH